MQNETFVSFTTMGYTVGNLVLGFLAYFVCHESDSYQEIFEGESADGIGEGFRIFTRIFAGILGVAWILSNFY